MNAIEEASIFPSQGQLDKLRPLEEDSQVHLFHEKLQKIYWFAMKKCFRGFESSM